MNINYEHYKVFYNVAKQGSITMAAHKLYISQPAVSKSIAQLEKELGCPLFIRHSTGMTLTPEGELLYSHIAIAYEEIALGESQLQSLRFPKSDMLRIAADDLAIRYLLGPKLHHFIREFPTHPLTLKQGTPDQVTEMVRQGTVDLGFTIFPQEHFPDLDTLPLGSYKGVFIASPEYIHPDSTTFDLADLIEHPIIYSYNNTSAAHYLYTLMGQQNIEPCSLMEVGTTDLVEDYVLHGCGIGITLHHLVTAKLEQKSLISLMTSFQLPPIERAIILRKHEKRTSLITNFLNTFFC
ncbi:LysR family transcriptional regulator [Eubacterium aggregans]|uniref:DNA-binding transcriptional regulator, LysR family n=1 Tax=Eubacterium aggregans TaxID=81409 RepID=A0A1H4E8Q7_9FIRM|nr:LysR family transcriptional regulator [Eubacterium aggregans]MDD4691968.1 LysR family transcriptional regulator [Eubacterium aggregans]SEA81118.1 DNA-binding transcriptional regulator, LysR family [Eubacterium aggregans]